MRAESMGDGDCSAREARGQRLELRLQNLNLVLARDVSVFGGGHPSAARRAFLFLRPWDYFAVMCERSGLWLYDFTDGGLRRWPGKFSQYACGIRVLLGCGFAEHG